MSSANIEKTKQGLVSKTIRYAGKSNYYLQKLQLKALKNSRITANNLLLHLA